MFIINVITANASLSHKRETIGGAQQIATSCVALADDAMIPDRDNAHRARVMVANAVSQGVDCYKGTLGVASVTFFPTADQRSRHVQAVAS